MQREVFRCDVHSPQLWEGWAGHSFVLCVGLNVLFKQGCRPGGVATSVAHSLLLSCPW